MAVNVDSLYEPYFHPPLTDTDYRTSSRGNSRRPSRKGSHSPMATSPALPMGEDLGDKKEEISVLDPRRFTPTLHANLVSEILSLRRDLESKNGLVLNLEENLAATKDENTQLQDSLAKHVRENKSVKRQMDTLEGGTLSAMEELAKERDTVKQSLAEFKQRLDVSQKKVRSQEQDAERAQAIYERDREKWEVERRLMDRKVHVVESRLRTVISEVESTHMQTHQRTTSHETSGRSYSRERPASRASGTRSAASRHRDSTNTNDSELRSKFSNSILIAGAKTLADELQFDEDSDPGSDGGYISPEALPEERPRPMSVQSHRQSIKARKLLGLAVDEENDEEKEIGRDLLQDFSAQAAETLDAGETLLPAYVDSSTQYSPPSPLLEVDPQRLSTINEIENDSVLEEFPFEQKGARDTTQRLEPVRHTTPVVMVSSACQTIESPLSPPETPTKDKKAPSADTPKVEMVTASTQTVQNDLYSSSAANSRDGGSLAADIPTIAIHTVGSESKRSSIVLPPHTRSVSCQVDIRAPVQSVAVQTEGIRIDERLERLPSHLHPSKILPYSPSPSPSPEVQKSRNSQSPALRSSLQLPSHSRPSSLRRSFTEDNVARRDFAHEAKSVGEDDEGHISDDSFLRKEPIKKTLTKVQDSWQLISQTDEEITDTETQSPRLPPLSPNRQRGRPGRSDREQKSPQKKFEERSGKVLTPIVTERPSDLKRTALISSGSAAHVQRGRSPSEPARLSRDSGPVPPFPVPDRSSSRKLPWSPSDGSGSPTWSRNSREKTKRQGRPPTKKPAMRKSRSAIGSGYADNRSRSRSPPPPFDSFAESLSSIPPPLPENEITSPYSASFKQPKSLHRNQDSVTSAAETVSSDQTSVVDAIAQTMIGEWMWKYVRRRKSFALPETTVNEYDAAQGKDGMMTGGMRHQRWVWVAPYERAVMWSSKQPTSGSALMGKSGRKLTITSVLDVRDDTPMPKGAPASSMFGRSILILTPQRALKFTASSLERHYVWLSALAFLSHTAVEIKDMGSSHTAVPALPTNEARPPNITGYRQVPQPPQPSPIPTLRRNRIQDSIRIAKGKDRPTPTKRSFTTPSTVTVNEIPGVASGGEDYSAEAPQVPRRTVKSGKKDNPSAKSRPTKSLRSFSSNHKPSLHSMQSRDGLGEVPPPRPTLNGSSSFAGDNSKGHSSIGTGFDSVGRRGVNWNASVHSKNGEAPNFFEAVGTVRMEAFVTDNRTYTNESKDAPRTQHSFTAPTNADIRDSFSMPLSSHPNVRPPPLQRYTTDPPPSAPATQRSFHPPLTSHPTHPSTMAAAAPVANTSAKRETRPLGFRKRSGNNSSSPATAANPPLTSFGAAVSSGSGLNSPISPTMSGRDPFEGFESGPPQGVWSQGV